MLLGIDIGGSKIAYALADPSGQILARRRRPTEPTGNPEQDLIRVADDAVPAAKCEPKHQPVDLAQREPVSKPVKRPRDQPAPDRQPKFFA